MESSITISPRDIYKNGIDEIDSHLGRKNTCDVCGENNPAEFHLYRGPKKTLSFCGECDKTDNSGILKYLLHGSQVYGSKIAKISEETGLLQKDVESTPRKLLSNNLVRRDKRKHPTRWFLK
ncbi:hypothetical protein AKJ44_02785 [candidate division MSBL1 archaeon SCGC-AAA261F17]|uniref:Uncharacterized protein n=1 Tax=candidate division MSBL1 archaeon SCGC-AAA261F17 TaxID=1698274 RepID=A0A133V490_9EURY|nr:hypothetical protein AKJ44_02785 [candidate division MSBL1 archaeon SCGC-AAA261F17]